MKDGTFIVIVVLILFMLISMSCNETFKNWKELELIKGYPVPQGDLSSLNYGKTDEFRKKSREMWSKVLNKNKIEGFTPPRPNTVLR